MTTFTSMTGEELLDEFEGCSRADGHWDSSKANQAKLEFLKAELLRRLSYATFAESSGLIWFDEAKGELVSDAPPEVFRERIVELEAQVSRLSSGGVGAGSEPVGWLLRPLRSDGAPQAIYSSRYAAERADELDNGRTESAAPFPVYAAAPPPPAGEWRPIESAPRDGTKIIGRLDNGRVAMVWWELNEPGWVDWQDEDDSEPRPTHWLPAPSLPADDAEKR